jgi:hypothetical protein
VQNADGLPGRQLGATLAPNLWFPGTFSGGEIFPELAWFKQILPPEKMLNAPARLLLSRK